MKLAQENPNELDHLIIRLKSDTQKLFNFLMGLEMTLVEQLEDVIKEIEQNYGQMASQAIDFARATFARCREIENEYNERASESVLSAFDRLIKMDLDELDEQTRDVSVIYICGYMNNHNEIPYSSWLIKTCWQIWSRHPTIIIWRKSMDKKNCWLAESKGNWKPFSPASKRLRSTGIEIE